jgi:hypothetical protein
MGEIFQWSIVLIRFSFCLRICLFSVLNSGGVMVFICMDRMDGSMGARTCARWVGCDGEGYTPRFRTS